MIDKYKIIKKIGSGGQGIVYLVKKKNKKYALKMKKILEHDIKKDLGSSYWREIYEYVNTTLNRIIDKLKLHEFYSVLIQLTLLFSSKKLALRGAKGAYLQVFINDKELNNFLKSDDLKLVDDLVKNNYDKYYLYILLYPEKAQKRLFKSTLKKKLMDNIIRIPFFMICLKAYHKKGLI